MSAMSFNASVLISEQLSRMMLNAAQDLAQRAVKECGVRYNFDAVEAIRLLELESVKVERKPISKKSVPKEKSLVAKPKFPLPFNGEFNDSLCFALRQNNGLYTQCQSVGVGEKHFCKSCQKGVDSCGVPEYGTIQQRLAVDLFEYVDPTGRKPVAYTKVMKKYKLSMENVLEEAGKFNIKIDSNHFTVPASAETKRGRPSAKDKSPKEPKGAKGRPKKAGKVLQIEGDDEEDLFAALVADANADDDEEMVQEKPASKKPASKKPKKTEEEKEADRIAKEAEKAEKETKLAVEKAEKEANLAVEKAEKEAKKEAERVARELKKAEEEAAKKAQKEEQRLKDKAEKEAKIAAEKEAKKSKPAKKAKKDDEEDGGNVVKKITFKDKKYLKSKKSGIVYDYDIYINEEKQVVVGQWNETTNEIDFSKEEEEDEDEDDEEEEEEYDE